MKNFKSLPLITFFIGLGLGVVLFFPFFIFTSQIEDALLRQAGIQARLGELRLGTGLGLGLGRGGLIALRGSHVSMTLDGSRSITCEDLVLSPHLLSLFMAQLELTAACDTGKDGSIVTVISMTPFWSPEKLRADVYLEDLKLSLFEGALGVSPLTGSLTGRVSVQTTLGPSAYRIPNVSWDASGDKITLPPVSSSFLNLPSIALGKFSSKGRLQNSGKTEIEDLRFGDKDSPIEGQIRGSLTIDRQFMPTGADIQGRLRTEAQFEKNDLKDFDLDTLFGKTKSSGQREFHKTAEGSLLGLLINPPLDNP